MSGKRPQRSRKLVKHGDDQLHWIEEKALQKALLRSIHEKDSPAKKKLKSVSSIKENVNEAMQSTSKDSNEGNIIGAHSSELNKTVLLKTKETSETETQCALRLTRLQSKLLEEAELYKSCKEFDSDALNITPKHCVKNQDKTLSSDMFITPEQSGCDIVNSEQKSSRKKLNFTNVSPVSDDFAKSNEYFQCKPTARLRAQRKFACNAYLAHRSESPVKMNKQKLVDPSWGRHDPDNKKRRSLRDRSRLFPPSNSNSFEKGDDESVSGKNLKGKNMGRKHGRSKSHQTLAPVFEKTPDADVFLDYLCFRNTTVQVDLYPKRKRR